MQADISDVRHTFTLIVDQSPCHLQVLLVGIACKTLADTIQCVLRTTFQPVSSLSLPRLLDCWMDSYCSRLRALVPAVPL
jgi:hypothetical protein